MLALINQILVVLLSVLAVYVYFKIDLQKDLEQSRKEWFYIDFKEQVTKQLMNKTIEKLRRCAE